MADLLECVIQIKALRETLALAETGRFHGRAGPADAEAAPVWRAWLTPNGATRRRSHGGWRPTAGATESGDSARARAAFAAGRRANLAMLGDCSAAQLGGRSSGRDGLRQRWPTSWRSCWPMTQRSSGAYAVVVRRTSPSPDPLPGPEQTEDEVGRHPDDRGARNREDPRPHDLARDAPPYRRETPVAPTPTIDR